MTADQELPPSSAYRRIARKKHGFGRRLMVSWWRLLVFVLALALLAILMS